MANLTIKGSFTFEIEVGDGLASDIVKMVIDRKFYPVSCGSPRPRPVVVPDTVRIVEEEQADQSAEQQDSEPP